MLNPQQLRAVELTDGPCLIIAGAGTGKTKTIVEKIAFLVKKGVDTSRILALTFSNEAAGQLKERAVELAPEAREARISTFHAFCAEFIRNHARECNVQENFNILEELDGAILLRRSLELQTGLALRYANTISKAKDLSLSIENYRSYLENQENILSEFYRKKDWEISYQRALVRLRTMHLDTAKSREEREKLQSFVDIYENYTAYSSFLDAWSNYEILKRERNSLDYADLNKIVLDYIEKYGPEELSVYDYVVVDEFQDTNKVQFQLLMHLSGEKRNITAVGDPNQTVYAFRGAYANNIDKFIKIFGLSPARIINLDTNYRSTDRILRSAHKLITNNYERDKPVPLHSFDSIEGERIRVIQTVDFKEQARRAVEEIETLAKNGLAYRDIAILYRSHSSATPLKKALNQRGIPYSTVGGAEFFYMPEIKTPIAYLYVLNNFNSPLLQAEQAWWKLLRGRFGLSGEDSTKLAEYRKKTKKPLQLILYSEIEKIGISKNGRDRIFALTDSIDTLRSKNKRISDTILDIYELSGVGREYNSNKEAMNNLKQLVQLAENFETFHGDDIQNFVAYLELVDEMGSKMESSKVFDEESVKLMTIHASKGLEFPAVIIVDMVRDKFPLTRGGAEPLIPAELNEQYADILSDRDTEKVVKEFTSRIKLFEERRLAYVAMTRAKRHLILTLAKEYGGKAPREPSIFLSELGAQQEWFVSGGASEDISLEVDTELKSKEGGDTEVDRAAQAHKRLMNIAMERRDLRTAQYHMIIYQSLLEGRSVGRGPAAKEAEKILRSITTNPTGLKFNPSAIAFSVTSLGNYTECPKKYELKHVLNMPSRDDEDDTVLGFGSVIHDVLDTAVKMKTSNRDGLNKILTDVTEKKNIKNFDFERAQRILDVFWARNDRELAKARETEVGFRFFLEGFNFVGKIDRIDDLGDGRIRIIDYKTGYINSDVSKDDRERQLILYALAVQHSQELQKHDWFPAELVLDMLEKEKPLEFILLAGTMYPKEGRIKPVTVEEVKKQIIDTAKKIAHDYEHGFNVADSDAPCRFCSYKLYCPKWG